MGAVNRTWPGSGGCPFSELCGGTDVDFAIRTEHLTKVYAGRVIAVNDLTLEVPRGSVYGLLGPNGAGKTTTLRLLLGLQRPTAGRAEVLGHRCGVNATSVRRSIGYLPTHPTFPGHLRPIEYLDLLGRLSRIPSAVRKPRLASLLRAVGLLGATEQTDPHVFHRDAHAFGYRRILVGRSTPVDLGRADGRPGSGGTTLHAGLDCRPGPDSDRRRRHAHSERYRSDL